MNLKNEFSIKMTLHSVKPFLKILTAFFAFIFSNTNVLLRFSLRNGSEVSPSMPTYSPCIYGVLPPSGFQISVTVHTPCLYLTYKSRICAVL